MGHEGHVSTVRCTCGYAEYADGSTVPASSLGKSTMGTKSMSTLSRTVNNVSMLMAPSTRQQFEAPFITQSMFTYCTVTRRECRWPC
jgi:hypothetical protein